MVNLVKLLLALIFVQVGAGIPLQAQTNALKKLSYQLLYPSLVSKFYALNQDKNFWFGKPYSNKLQTGFLEILDSAKYLGLNTEEYHYKVLSQVSTMDYMNRDSSLINDYDKLFTDAAIAFLKDLYQGKRITAEIISDEVSPKFEDQDNDFLLNRLTKVSSELKLRNLVTSLQPVDKTYKVLIHELKNQFQDNPEKIAQLASALNYLRWIYHFRFKKFIVVNIPSATLYYYEAGSIKLTMKVIAGKASTATPRMATYCNEVILYPYWNIPVSITRNELLPMIKKNPKTIENLNLQVIDAEGNIMDHQKLNWLSYTKHNFPYRLRQSTGCDNALGIIKFNLTCPYSIYIHDTNNKTLFASDHRFYSHGCIRIEKPVELANELLTSKIDTVFLRSGVKNQKPVSLPLDSLVPVFVVYMTTEKDKSGVVQYFQDVYSLYKK